jgi:hypothetical protein
VLDFGRKYVGISTYERSWSWFANEDFEYLSSKVGFFVMVHLDV